MNGPRNQPPPIRKTVSFDVTLAEFLALERYAARERVSKAAVLRDCCQPLLDRIVGDVTSATDAARM